MSTTKTPTETTIHPTERRLRKMLAGKCKATTRQGLVRYIRAHPGCIVQPPLGRTQNYYWRQEEASNYPSRIPRSQRWTTTERAKRRAAHDPIFRRARKSEHQRIATITAARYSPERYDAATRAVRDARKIGIEIEIKIDARIGMVSASRSDIPYAPIGHDATVAATLETPRRDRTAGSTIWDHKGRPHYTRCSDDSYVLSAAVLLHAGREIDYHFQSPGGDRAKFRWIAPAGCRWDRDGHGLRLVRGGDDYHPTSAELRAPKAAEKILAELEKNAAQRRKIAAERAVECAEAAGVWVGFADSRAAGNCADGTKNWAQKHHLDIRQHVPAQMLFATSNGDWQRVRLAIRAATTRHQREMQQGYADLAEHAVV